MSDYATLQNFKDHLGYQVSPPGRYNKLTDRVSYSVANDAVGQELIDQAEGELNQLLSSRYQTPIAVASNTTTAGLLRNYTLRIATYLAYTSNRKFKKAAPTDDYQKVMKMLEGYASGNPVLPGVNTLPSPTSTVLSGRAGGFARKYTEDALDGI